MDDLLRLDAEIQIQASDAAKPAKISGIAYSGAIMAPSGWGDTAADTAQMELAPTVPLVADHENNLGGLVGSVRPRVDRGQLLIDGEISRNSETGAKIIALARDGIQFSLSVGLQVLEKSYLSAGERLQINGKSLTAGPRGLSVVHKSKLREVSLVPAGADADATATIAASLSKGKTTMIENEKEPTPAEQLRADALAESQRLAGILKATVDHADLQATAIESGWTVPETELAVLKAELSKGPNIHVKRGGASPTRDALEASLLLRTGGADIALKAFGERTVQQAEDLRIRNLGDLLTASLRLDGQDIPRDPNEMMRAAFSTMSLPGILSNAQNKTLLQTYNDFPSVARQIARILTAANFKQHDGHRLTGDFVLERVAPSGELAHAHPDESSFDFTVKTYGRMFTCTRVDIINDDLSAFSEIPRQIARGAALAVESAFWTLVLANTGSFFDPANNNYISGADTALDIDSLSEAVQTMRQLVDDDGHPVLVVPKFLVVPPELEAVADGLFTSLNIAVAGDTDIKIPAGNIASGKYQPMITPYLSNATYSGYSATGWYLFGDPSDVAAFGIAYLNGREAPTVEDAPLSGDVLGQGWRGYLDFGVCQIDTRGAVKSAGV